jgi:RimJ/RimL family protein N-acetyltransferase
MAHPYWLLFDLRLRTQRLELRYPDEELLIEIACLAARGIHDPECMPFAVPWTDQPSPELEADTLRFFWGRRATFRPNDWSCPFAVLLHKHVVGVQDLFAKDFATLRTVETGSWAGREYQRHGLGTEMRSAVLHLAFAGLGAVEAYSGAWHDSAASSAVSRKFGICRERVRWQKRRDGSDRMVLLRLDRGTWERHRREDVTIEGLEPCLEWFGAAR